MCREVRGLAPLYFARLSSAGAHRSRLPPVPAMACKRRQRTGAHPVFSTSCLSTRGTLAGLFQWLPVSYPAQRSAGLPVDPSRVFHASGLYQWRGFPSQAMTALRGSSPGSTRGACPGRGRPSWGTDLLGWSHTRPQGERPSPGGPGEGERRRLSCAPADRGCPALCRTLDYHCRARANLCQGSLSP